MTRIQINDLEAPEKELTEKEMGSVTGGFIARDGTAMGRGSWVYAGTQKKRVIKGYRTFKRPVYGYKTRKVYNMRGRGFGKWV